MTVLCKKCNTSNTKEVKHCIHCGNMSEDTDIKDESGRFNIKILLFGFLACLCLILIITGMMKNFIL